MAIRPAIRPLADELLTMLTKFREEHAEELRLIGDIDISVTYFQVRVNWDPKRVYDDQAPAAERYQL